MTNEEIKNEVRNDMDGFVRWLDENGWYKSPVEQTHFANDKWPCSVPFLLVAQMWLDDRARKAA